MSRSYSNLVDTTKEELRLKENANKEKYWLKWGPYLSERAWATVREDYSYNGDAWSDFPFEQAKSRVFRWGEDGIFGVSDNHQLVCFSLAMWNDQDEILKERLFGVTGPQGNHGEDVKELYYYLDNTPTHSYMKALYKYPHKKFPYKHLVEENGKRTRQEREYEVNEVEGLFEDNGDKPYFDVFFEMAKSGPDELLFRITAYNRGNKAAPLHLVPQVFFRNTWAWNETDEPKPQVNQIDENAIGVNSAKYGARKVIFAPSPGFDDDEADIEPELLFTENESNLKQLYGQPNRADYCKDAFNEYIVDGIKDAVNPAKEGTKAAAHFHFESVPAGEYVTLRYKFTNDMSASHDIDEEAFDDVFEDREDEADNFYWRVSPLPLSDELRNIQRQAFAGLMWSKQFYHFVQQEWANGDSLVELKPPKHRANGRNGDWKHLYIDDILSLPDKWEYPFFAAWDTAFHCIPLAMIDPEFAKKQLDLLTREWYMHPNGQIPAYEWNFSDVNPPVHAWAVYRVFKIERKMYQREDYVFLERVFQKLLLNFTWWVNRKDSSGKNLFEGGFLGLDNIGIFNRSEPLPTGGTLEQADSTGWMAFFCLQMLNIALELAKKNPVYEDIASKFFEHFIFISDAMSYDPEDPNKSSLWNEEDQFYYDAISWGGDNKQQLPIRSLVGLIPLYASMTLEPQILEKFPSFKKRVEWFINKKSTVANRNIASMEHRGVGERLLLSLVDKEKLIAILRRMLDENEFLSDYGIRSMSKYHEKHPFTMNVHGQDYCVSYLPGESDSGMFGGNSNWRGPIWFPTNFLLVESLQRFFLYYGPELKVECPVGSGEYLNLAQVAEELEHRLIHLFVPDSNGIRAVYGEDSKMLSTDEHFSYAVPFYEYFDGDTGRGLGASHQCGWTSLVAKWIHDTGVSCVRLPRTPRSSLSIATLKDMRRDSSASISSMSPQAPRLSRRRSGKSMMSLTASLLELTEEESLLHQDSVRKGLTRTNTREYVVHVPVSPAQDGVTTDEEDEHDLFQQIRIAMQNADQGLADELETH